jgi:hypothetical protein
MRYGSFAIGTAFDREARRPHHEHGLILRAAISGVSKGGVSTYMQALTRFSRLELRP